MKHVMTTCKLIEPKTQPPPFLLPNQHLNFLTLKQSVWSYPELNLPNGLGWVMVFTQCKNVRKIQMGRHSQDPGDAPDHVHWKAEHLPSHQQLARSQGNLISDFGSIRAFQREALKQFSHLDQPLQTLKELVNQLVPAIKTLDSHIKCVATFHDPVLLYNNTLSSTLNDTIINCLPISIRQSFFHCPPRETSKPNGA